MNIKDIHPGDKVIVRKPELQLTKLIWIGSMDRWDGKEVTVKEINPEHHIQTGDEFNTLEAINPLNSSHYYRFLAEWVVSKSSKQLEFNFEPIGSIKGESK